MRKTFFFILIHCVLIILFSSSVHAKYDPLSEPNNKYGIHIADTNNIPEIPELINSNGGDWGYVTLVIQEDDRDVGKWQNIFNEMRRLHLIPIVRLATYPKDDAWAIPEKHKYHEWVDFLGKLNWVIENRYVVLFNEPNHANEWGNTLDPEGYAETLVELGKMLKESDPDYFILPAGFDFSASTISGDMDAREYVQRVIQHKPEILDLIDGWTSHSYPNPAFSAPPTTSGKGSIRSFIWETNFLVTLGLGRALPIFITETGWKHSEGKIQQSNLLSPQQVASYYTQASAIWQHPLVVAVTPFVYSYQGEPFDHFSFKKFEQEAFHEHYYAFQKLQKQKGEPKQHHRVYLDTQLIPETLVAGSMYTFGATLHNVGQSIISHEHGFSLTIKSEDNSIVPIIDNLPTIEPGQSNEINITLYTPKDIGTKHIEITLDYQDDSIHLEKHEVELIPPPALDIRMQLAWKKDNSAKNIKAIVYDKEDRVIHEFSDLTLTKGRMNVPDLYGVVPNRSYRVVVVVPSYLPQQAITKLQSTVTTIYMPRLLPLDLNNDGTFNAKDIPHLIAYAPIHYLYTFVK